MNDMLELHDGLNDIRHEGRREGFAAGVIVCVGVIAYAKMRKRYTIVRTERGFKATTEK